MKGLEGQERCSGGNQMDDTHHHRAVTKCPVLRVSIEHGRSRLVEHCHRGFIHIHSGAMRARRRWQKGLLKIQHLGTAWLIPSEVPAWQQNTAQRRMIGVHARVNVRYNAAPCHFKSSLRLKHADELRRGLIHVAILDGSAEIRHVVGVVEPSRDRARSV